MNKVSSAGAWRQTGLTAAALTALVMLSACGGGGGADASPSPSPAPNPSPSPTPPPPPPPPAPAPAPEISSTSLETSAAPVLNVATDIDDSGRVAVLFAQSIGGRVALQAVRGTPGARGVAPVFSQPEVIDTLAPYDSTVDRMGLTLSPVGNALARWIVVAPCTATTYSTVGNCNYVYTARRLVNGNWEAPLLAGDAPALPTAIINDAGDVAMLWPTGRRNAQGADTLGVVWKAAAAAQFTTPTVFNDIQAPAGSDVGFTLDKLGNMVYVSLSVAGSGQKQVVVRRGNLTAGFNPTERLDTQTSDALFEGIWGGVNGQVVVHWQQASGGLTSRWAAALDGPTALAWQVSDRGAPRSSTRVISAVADNGDFMRYELDNCLAVRRQAGVWQADAALPAGMCPNSTSFVSALSRTGSLVGGLVSPSTTTDNTGQWLAYDAAQNALTQSFSTAAGAYLFGTPSNVGGVLLLSENGVAAMVSRNNYDTLPSASATTGTLGLVANLWVTYLKLP